MFVPTLPPLYDLAALDRMLVGLSDGAGGFIGLGLLGYVRGRRRAASDHPGGRAAQSP